MSSGTGEALTTAATMEKSATREKHMMIFRDACEHKGVVGGCWIDGVQSQLETAWFKIFKVTGQAT